MSFRFAVADDCVQDRVRLQNDLSAWLRNHESMSDTGCEAFSSGMELLQNGGMSGRFSAVFLDICMDGLSGIETAYRLRAAQPDCLIVFITSEKSYALDAFPLHPFDYLVKPYSKERLSFLMADITRVLPRSVEEAEFRVAYGTIRLPVSGIVSAVSSGHGMNILLSDGKAVTVLTSFSEMQTKLSAWPCFLTVNRGIIVNMDHALRINNGSIMMTGQVSYPLRVRNQNELIRQFTQYQIKHRMGGI